MRLPCMFELTAIAISILLKRIHSDGREELAEGRT
jgi:hypothetical protein